MPPLVLLGCGYTLSRLARRHADVRPVLASTRDPERAEVLRAFGVRVDPDPLVLARGSGGAHVVVGIPPEAGLDGALAAAFAEARPARLVYLSSTGVYGDARGEVDEDTPVDPDGRGAGRLRAERLYAPFGGVALRVAAIYGPGRGLHERLRAGGFRLPGDGTGHVSRVHVDDLVTAIEVALDHAQPGTVLAVADDRPAPLGEVVDWLCARLGLPRPPSVPIEAAPPTLRGDRRVSNRRLRALGWTPRYPSHEQGFGAILD